MALSQENQRKFIPSFSFSSFHTNIPEILFSTFWPRKGLRNRFGDLITMWDIFPVETRSDSETVGLEMPLLKAVVTCGYIDS